MPKNRSLAKAVENKTPLRKSKATMSPVKQVAALVPARSDYVSILTGSTQLIADSRRRALATVNR